MPLHWKAEAAVVAEPLLEHPSSWQLEWEETAAQVVLKLDGQLVHCHPRLETVPRRLKL